MIVWERGHVLPDFDDLLGELLYVVQLAVLVQHDLCVVHRCHASLLLLWLADRLDVALLLAATD